jgi:hypothetical protein
LGCPHYKADSKGAEQGKGVSNVNYSLEMLAILSPIDGTRPGRTRHTCTHDFCSLSQGIHINFENMKLK